MAFVRYGFPVITNSVQTPNIIGSLKHRVDLLEMEMLVAALKSANGNMTAAALQLGITPRMARYKIKKLGIDYQSFCQTRR